MQAEFAQPHLHTAALGMPRHTDIIRKQRERVRLPVIVQRFNLLDPRRALRIVDLAQIQDMPFNRPARCSSLLRDAEVAMLLAVFESSMTLQIPASRLPTPTHLARTKVCT